MSHDCDNFTGSMGCLVTMISLLQLGELLQKKSQQVFLEVFSVERPPSALLSTLSVFVSAQLKQDNS